MLRAKFLKNGGLESPLGPRPADRAVLCDAGEAAWNPSLELGRRIEQYYLTQGRRLGIPPWTSADG